MYPFAPLAGSYAGHNLGAVFEHLLGVKRAFAAGDALHNQAGVVIYKNSHWYIPRLSKRRLAARLGSGNRFLSRVRQGDGRGHVGLFQQSHTLGRIGAHQPDNHWHLCLHFL